ncbi:hypothetical protein TWF481_010404 [Arthrobotrys musiformis]|uniref:Uncharacterized protein n=1 Tax=Arthrobotrys musiformis TaxID=47236 RepID=A0AAV9W0T0_9PEZI
MIRLYRRAPLTLRATKLRSFLRRATGSRSGWSQHRNKSVHIYLNKINQRAPLTVHNIQSWHFEDYENTIDACSMLKSIESTKATFWVRDNVDKGVRSTPSQPHVPCLVPPQHDGSEFEATIYLIPLLESTYLSGFMSGSAITRSLSAFQANTQLKMLCFTGMVGSGPCAYRMFREDDFCLDTGHRALLKADLGAKFSNKAEDSSNTSGWGKGPLDPMYKATQRR